MSFAFSPDGRYVLLKSDGGKRVLLLDVHTGQAVQQLLATTPDKSRLMLSCAGGMPPGVSTANIQAFLDAIAR